MQEKQSEEGCVSVAAPDVLSGGNGGMCLFPCALHAGRLVGAAEQGCDWEDVASMPTCGKGRSP